MQLHSYIVSLLNWLIFAEVMTKKQSGCFFALRMFQSSASYFTHGSDVLQTWGWKKRWFC